MFSDAINVRFNSKSLRSFRRSKAISGTQKVLAKGASLGAIYIYIYIYIKKFLQVNCVECYTNKGSF